MLSGSAGDCSQCAFTLILGKCVQSNMESVNSYCYLICVCCGRNSVMCVALFTVRDGKIDNC